MAQFWIAIFFILLAGAQLYQSVKDIALPFPVYLVLGTVLAVAANSRYKFGSIGSERVTLQEIKEPTPTIAPNLAIAATAVSAPPQIAAAETQAPAATEPTGTAKLPDLKPAKSPPSTPIQSDETTSKKPSRPRKSSPKQPKKQS